jgi:hypothetical protein
MVKLTCGLMSTATTMTCDLIWIYQIVVTEKGNASEGLKKSISIVISSTQPLKIDIETLSFPGEKWNKTEV